MKISNDSKETSYIPLVSIVIPTYNGGKYIEKCLDAILSLTYSKKEIIVIDDGSTDNTWNTLETYKKRLPYLKVLRHKTNKGPASARNLGIRTAKGDVIFFTDDDCVVEKEWINKHLRWYTKNKNIVGVGGLLVPKYFQILDLIDFYRHKEAYIDKRVLYNYHTIGTNNGSYKNSILKCLGGFDTRFRFAGGEDTDLAIRASKKGLTVLDPFIKVYHLKTNRFGTKKVREWIIRGKANHVFDRKYKNISLWKISIPIITIAKCIHFLPKLQNMDLANKMNLLILFFAREFFMDIGYLISMIKNQFRR